MKKIHELPKKLQAKLAAGEVIERPAYIVKELIDNAIDAEATVIRIDLEKSGLHKIIVIDNGVGMSKEDIEICFHQFTTSKIFFEEDLHKIGTMGFRGEALASIAAISTLTIKSREKKTIAGTEIVISDNEIKSISAKGMPVGTQIIVEDIFALVPARKKFLKSQLTEYRVILEIIFRYVLAFPQIRFDVYHDGKKVQLHVSGSLENRLLQLFSQEVITNLLSFSADHEYFSITGFISKPQISYQSARNMYYFVNSRFITDIEITNIIRNTYGTLLEPGRYPHIIVFITIPPHLVDINIHPRKEEVHFSDKEMILHSLEESITKTLSAANLRYYDKRWSGDEKEFEEWQIRDGGTQSYVANTLRKSIKKDILLTIEKNTSLFQFYNLYIALPTEKGILFFDQHAVHERILYEKLQKSFQEELSKKSHLRLKQKLHISISPKEKVFFEEFEQDLRDVGFDFIIEDEEIIFKSIPHILQDSDLSKMIREVIDDLYEKKSIRFDSINHKMLAYIACRSAVKSGDHLSQDQCKDLITQLFKTENPYTCPHGRPTQVEVPITYFHKLFKRK